MYVFVKPSAAAVLNNNVKTSHLVLHMSKTRKYVMAVLTQIQGTLCDKSYYYIVQYMYCECIVPL